MMKYSNQEINLFLKNHPIELQDIALELRNLVFRCAPNASERILWRGLSYYKAELGGPVKGSICQISVREDTVRLAFIHGSFLPDPENLLRGDRKAKRYMEIKSLEDAPWGEMEELIRAAVEFDPTAMA